MAWKKIERDPLEEGDVWKYEKEGDEISGELVSIKDDVGPNKSKLYTLRYEEGGKDKEIAIWGTTILDDLMKKVKVNDFVRIVYRGMEKSEKTKREYKTFEVYVDAPEEVAEEEIRVEFGE